VDNQRPVVGAKAAQRILAWWNGDAIDRPLMAVRAPRKKPRFRVPELTEPADPMQRWIDADYRIGVWEKTFATTHYLGEAFPYFDSNIGPGSLGLFLGARPGFAWDTVWYHPIIEDLRNAPDLRFDPHNQWFQAHVHLIEEGLARSNGRYLVSLPDLIENLDTLAALRGNAALLVDLLESPGAVHRFQKQILPLYKQYYDDLYARVTRPGMGCCFSAFAVWGPGRVAKLQCDMSAMISPKMFEEFVAPYLSEQCEWLDYSVYHLDGPDAIRHLDLLLGIPRLNAIQWTPGAGQPGVGSPEWYPLLERIRARGKAAQWLGVGVHEVQPLIERFGPAGLYISTEVRTREEGLALLRAARTWKKTNA
jgi:5-methyltetrahydrofolate--homocysteine methyltransferase